jgi:RHH-type proline utilization regulon transcriptional repressor/proline dehydrogenase/delta 1-pyrroline-5-carboxylate dehydrogenase
VPARGQTAAGDLPAAVKDRIQTVSSLENCEFQIALVEDMLSASLHAPGGP